MPYCSHSSVIENNPDAYARQNSRRNSTGDTPCHGISSSDEAMAKSVTHVPGQLCYLSLWTVPPEARSQKPEARSQKPEARSGIQRFTSFGEIVRIAPAPTMSTAETANIPASVLCVRSFSHPTT